MKTILTTVSCHILVETSDDSQVYSERYEYLLDGQEVVV